MATESKDSGQASTYGAVGSIKRAPTTIVGTAAGQFGGIAGHMLLYSKIYPD